MTKLTREKDPRNDILGDRYIWFSDPGHAWLRVPLADLQKLGIAHEISGFSYINDGYAYLEEDEDAGRFLKAKRYHKLTDFNFDEKFTNKDSIVRSYRMYQPDIWKNPNRIK